MGQTRDHELAMMRIRKHSQKLAILTAVCLEVGCPACGEPQPDPETGSHMWTPEEVRVRAVQDLLATGRPGDMVCCACDHPFNLQSQPKVMVAPQ